MLVEGGEFGNGEYLSNLIDYVHLNPVRAGLIELQANQSLSEYRWSSLASGYLVAARKRARCMKTDEGFRTASNEKCGECMPAVRTETGAGKSQREIVQSSRRSSGVLARKGVFLLLPGFANEGTLAAGKSFDRATLPA